MVRKGMNGPQRAAVAMIAVLIAGVVLVGVGCWMWWRPAGLIAPGALLVLIGIIGFFGVDVESGDR